VWGAFVSPHAQGPWHPPGRARVDSITRCSIDDTSIDNYRLHFCSIIVISRQLSDQRAFIRCSLLATRDDDVIEAAAGNKIVVAPRETRDEESVKGTEEEKKKEKCNSRSYERSVRIRRSTPGQSHSARETTKQETGLYRDNILGITGKMRIVRRLLRRVR